MSALNSFVTAFCVSCIALGTLYVLVPKGNMSSAVKYAFCLVFLCVILTAAFKIGTVDILRFDARSEDFADERFSAATAQMVLSEALSSENINFTKITVFTDKNETGGINITKVYVYTAEREEKVREIIGSDAYELVVINE